MITLETLELLSETNRKVVPWTLAREQETDEGSNTRFVIMARYGNEVRRFSPNITDWELRRYAQQINKKEE